MLAWSSRPTCCTCRSRSWRRGRRCWSCTPPSTARSPRVPCRSGAPCSASSWRGRSGNAMGLDLWSVGVLLVVGLAIGALPWFEGQSTAVAATGLIVLTTGFANDDSMLLTRLLGHRDRHRRRPRRQRGRLAAAAPAYGGRRRWTPSTTTSASCSWTWPRELKKGVTQEGVEDWVRRTRDLDSDIDHAWALVRQASESARLNPRRAAGELKGPPAVDRPAAPHSTRRSPRSGAWRATHLHALADNQGVAVRLPRRPPSR